MPKALDEITKDALELAPRERLVLAGFLLESTDGYTDPEAEAEWDVEIRRRVLAIEQGQISGIAYEDAMREAETRLAP